MIQKKLPNFHFKNAQKSPKWHNLNKSYVLLIDFFIKDTHNCSFNILIIQLRLQSADHVLIHQNTCPSVHVHVFSITLGRHVWFFCAPRTGFHIVSWWHVICLNTHVFQSVSVEVSWFQFSEIVNYSFRFILL